MYNNKNFFKRLSYINEFYYYFIKTYINFKYKKKRLNKIY